MKISLSKLEYRKGILLILFFGIILFIFQLGSTGLIDETPPLFASASRAMSETGNWLTPRVNGLNRFDKPPLIYWLMGVFYSLPGQDIWDPFGTWSARLPSAISSLSLMLVIGDTLMKWPGGNENNIRRTALVGALAFGLSPIVLIWSRIAVSDAVLCCTLGVSLLLSWRTYASSSDKNWWISWIFLGLAVLTKGPVAIALMLITFTLFGFVQADYIMLIKKIKPLRGLCIVFFVSAPWYIAELIVEGKPFWDSFFGYHNFQRLTMVVNSHSQPWWFFIMMLIISSFPFTPFLVLGLTKYLTSLFRLEKKSYRNDLSLFNFTGSWLCAVFLLFTVAATKLPSYWLPAVPAASIIIALMSSDNEESGNKLRIKYLITSSLLCLIATLFAFPDFWLFYINDPEIPNFSNEIIESRVNMKASIILYFASFIGFYFTVKPRFKGIYFIQLVLILFQIFVMLPMWKLADRLRQYPLREVSKQVISNKYPDEPIAMIGIRKPSLHFYTKELIFYESNDVVSLVNLSDRISSEIRSKWLRLNRNLSFDESKTLILVIDNQTSSLEHWQGLNPKKISQIGIYKVWRVQKNVLEQRVALLKANGIQPNWRIPKNERF